MSTLWQTLEELKGHTWVELSHELYQDSPAWSGFPDGAIELNKTCIDWGECEGMEFKIYTQKFVGQFGTHIDAPAHFIRDGRPAGDFGVKDLCLPLVVIDVSDKVKENIDYELQMSDIEDFEAKYGKIPAGCFVAMRTDWCKRWPDGDKMTMADETGQEHYPGWTMDTLKFLIEERGVAAVGHEPFDTDAAVGSAAAGDIQCERYVLAQDKFQIEVMDNLDQVPPTGAIIFVAFPRIMEANGMPARVWAILPD
jgi:Predicted metal-dependent hydrolase